jgi:hypothetical protein
VLVLIFLVAKLKDERVEACNESTNKVLVEIEFVKILLVKRLLFIKDVKEPVAELIFSAAIEYVEIVDALRVTVDKLLTKNSSNKGDNLTILVAKNLHTKLSASAITVKKDWGIFITKSIDPDSKESPPYV